MTSMMHHQESILRLESPSLTQLQDGPGNVRQHGVTSRKTEQRDIASLFTTYPSTGRSDAFGGRSQDSSPLPFSVGRAPNTRSFSRRNLSAYEHYARNVLDPSRATSGFTPRSSIPTLRPESSTGPAQDMDISDEEDNPHPIFHSSFPQHLQASSTNLRPLRDAVFKYLPKLQIRSPYSPPKLQEFRARPLPGVSPSPDLPNFSVESSVVVVSSDSSPGVRPPTPISITPQPLSAAANAKSQCSTSWPRGPSKRSLSQNITRSSQLSSSARPAYSFGSTLPRQSTLGSGVLSHLPGSVNVNPDDGNQDPPSDLTSPVSGGGPLTPTDGGLIPEHQYRSRGELQGFLLFGMCHGRGQLTDRLWFVFFPEIYQNNFDVLARVAAELESTSKRTAILGCTSSPTDAMFDLGLLLDVGETEYKYLSRTELQMDRPPRPAQPVESNFNRPDIRVRTAKIAPHSSRVTGKANSPTSYCLNWSDIAKYGGTIDDLDSDDLLTSKSETSVPKRVDPTRDPDALLPVPKSAVGGFSDPLTKENMCHPEAVKIRQMIGSIGPSGQEQYERIHKCEHCGYKFLRRHDLKVSHHLCSRLMHYLFPGFADKNITIFALTATHAPAHRRKAVSMPQR